MNQERHWMAMWKEAKAELKKLGTKCTNLGLTVTDLKNQLKVERDKVKDFAKERKKFGDRLRK